MRKGTHSMCNTLDRCFVKICFELSSRSITVWVYCCRLHSLNCLYVFPGVKDVDVYIVYFLLSHRTLTNNFIYF